MSALALAEAFSPREISEMKVAQQVRMQNLVRDARATALRDQNQWIAAIHNLTDAQEIAITHAVMHGDHCEAGRILREALQMVVLDTATDRARDDIAERFGVHVGIDA